MQKLGKKMKLALIKHKCENLYFNKDSRDLVAKSSSQPWFNLLI